MSTVGLELSSFINPDLSWNPLAKGYRSGLRRTRKPVARNFAVETKLLDGKAQKVDDRMVSDAEKANLFNGVAVSGRSNKTEHSAKKKRRSVFQFPTPPLQFEGFEPNPNGKRRRRIANTPVKGNVSWKKAEVYDNKFDNGDEFLGIEMLASVACNNIMLNDDEHDQKSSLREESIRGGVGSSSCGVTFEETALSQKDLIHEDKMEVMSVQNSIVISPQQSPSDVHENTMDVSSLQNCSVIGPQNSPEIKDGITAKGFASAGRLNFDLNVAWEQPGDILNVDSGANFVQRCEIRVGPEDLGNKSPNRVVSSNVHGDYHMSMDLKSLAFGTHGSIREEPKSEASTGPDGNHDEVIAFPTISAQESPICGVFDTKDSSQIADMDACLGHSACLEVSEENRDPLLSGHTLKQSAEVCCSDVQLDNVLCKGSGQVEICNVSSPHAPEVDRVACEIDCTSLNEDVEERVSSAHEDRKSIQDVICLDECQPVAPVFLGVEPGIQAEESGANHCLPNSGDIPASSVFPVGGHPVTTVDAKGQADEASTDNAAEFDSPAHADSEEPMQRSSTPSSVALREACRVQANSLTSGLIEVTTEDPSDDSVKSDVDQADKVHIVGTENTLELQANYDSQFEDGEFRESDACYNWGENEVEDGEVEHVDYGSEFEEDSSCGLDDAKEVKIERGSSPGPDNVTTKIENCGTRDYLRNESVSPKRRASDVITNKDFPSGMARSRASNRESLSHIEEFGAICRKDGIRSREETSNKFMGWDRAASHMYGRSPGRHQFTNHSTGYWDSDRHYSPNYRGAGNFGTSRPKYNNGSRRYSDHVYSEAAGFDNRAHRQFSNSSSNGVYERSIRTRSPTYRDDAYAMYTGGLLLRDGSPNRSRFRRYPQRFTRGIREDYHRSMPDDNIEYSNHFAQKLPRRERSVSPFRRGRPRYTTSHKESWSRSRSRSPNAYLPPREIKEGSRHSSRSPDFRSAARMDRAEFEEGFVPQTRSRFSKRHSRWFDSQNGALDNFRGRKSPVNAFWQNRRFDSVHTNLRLDSDDHFAPMAQSRKFPDMGGAGRGGEYEGSDDDRRKKLNNRYDMVHRERRYERDGVVQRYRYSAEEAYVANNYDYDDCDRVTDRRPWGEVVKSSYSEIQS